MSDLSHLPSDPETFFGLKTGYDRRDLKRAYGKAIRQYKPETCPNEFRLIRDAYERLEKLLRYGKQEQARVEAVEAWSEAAPTAEGSSSDPADRVASHRSEGSDSRSAVIPKREPSLRQLAAVDPAAAHRKLADKARRSPQDYYLAAVLADAVKGKPTSQYLGQLLEGLVAHPADPGLTALATEYLRLEIPIAMAPKVSQLVSRKLRSPLFYMLTEPLWLRMIETEPFDKVQALLKSCEADVVQSDPSTRITFYLRFLRSAIWKAPSQWTSQVLAEIEARSAELDMSSQSDLEFLVELHQLLVKEVGQDPKPDVREKLLRAIQMACSVEGETNTPAVIRLLNEVAKDAAGTQQAFPLGEEQDDSSWVTVIYHLVHQLNSFLDEPDRLTHDRMAAQTLHLLNDLTPNVEAVLSSYERARWRYKMWPLVIWMIVGSVVGVVPMIGISFALSGSEVGGLAAVGGIILLFFALGGAFFYWIYPRYLKEREDRAHRRWAMQDYTNLWRSRLFRYAQSIGDSMETQLAVISSVSQQSGNPNMGYVVERFARQDPGLHVFSALQLLLR